MDKSIRIYKVVSRNFIEDIIARFQNIFGFNLKGYEKMIERGMQQIQDELKDTRLAWYRYEITELTNGAMAILLYGERK